MQCFNTLPANKLSYHFLFHSHVLHTHATLILNFHLNINIEVQGFFLPGTFKWKFRNFNSTFNVDRQSNFHNQFENVFEIEFIWVAIKYARVTYFILKYFVRGADCYEIATRVCVWVCVCVSVFFIICKTCYLLMMYQIFILLYYSLFCPIFIWEQEKNGSSKHRYIYSQIYNKKYTFENYSQMQLCLVYACVCVGMLTDTRIMKVNFVMMTMHVAFARDYRHKYKFPL